MQLANTGRGAIDAGGSTSLNPATGDEFSRRGRLYLQFQEPDTQYQSCVDFHFDWGVSHFLS